LAIEAATTRDNSFPLTRICYRAQEASNLATLASSPLKSRTENINKEFEEEQVETTS